MNKHEYNDDLYGILGLEAGAEAKDVARAYKKKSLKHHPDRGGDVKKFLELKNARDILLDEKKKEEYDKKLSHELMARKRQRERDAEMGIKRRRMQEEMLRKERDAELGMKQPKSRKSELTRLREQWAQAGVQQRETEKQKSAETRPREDSNVGGINREETGSKSQRTVTFKWDKKKFSHSDDTIARALREYGVIESIKMKSSSAKVVFADKRSVAHVIRIEGHKDCWRSVILQGHLVDSDDTFEEIISDRHDTKTTSTKTYLPSGPIDLATYVDYEKHVLEKLRDRIKARSTHTQCTSVH